jgi:glycosyltransferase involved in cell wall biosynthesis
VVYVKRYTILHTIETGGPGGAETVLLELATNLDSSRFRSLALLPSGSWLPKQLQARGIPTVIAQSKAWYDLHLPRVMRQLVRQERVDLIHSHLPDQNFYSCLVGHLAACKTVVTYHGTPGVFRNGRTRSAVKSWVVRHAATAVVVVSDYLGRVLTQLGFPAKKIVRIYNGVDIKQFACQAGGRLRAELGFPANAKMVGMVANLRQSKGYEYFIQAARQVTEAIPEARFVAVGEKDDTIANQLDSLIRQLGLEDRCVFLGFRSDVPQILSDLDVFVLSSVSEGLSIATIEAMAAGKPVVVTRSGGPEEVVEEGRTGFLVPPADPSALASRICEVLRSPDLAATLSRNAQAEAESKFSLALMVSEYESLYERCLGAG